ncbi:peptidyl-tRNA hydrolase [Duganella sp. Leaf126]|uniref:EpsD family peptidyl-prolyl cis-trans isomerase n=1 Tax=Duganella sp. Leaf126 TaxID=1736266 RepID=UPI0006F63780|nr:EpsD family peptidyl-prolyl cis-trans isomerase [Duganella sp. Leaf126]KQQ46352.1 peptidyl-tRNA hydrolase [Duganella sp. Leaf126]
MKHTLFGSTRATRAVGTAALAVALAASLAACGKGEQKSGQALVKVGKEEITALQVNEELQRANVPPAQQAQARKQIIESLIDRQVVLNQAMEDKLDRDPKVVQAIERAKALIIAQAYMQKHAGSPSKPSKTEIQDYFNKNPLLFSQRKTMELRQLNLATSDLSDELKKEIDNAKSIDEVASYLDRNGIKYARQQISRSTADLAPALSEKLVALPKGQLFIVREGDRSTLMTITDIKDTPVDLASSEAQIAQFLMNTRTKDGATAEIARLRGATKIEYLNKADAPGATPPAAAPAAAAPAATSDADAHARGVAGLK